MRVDIDSYNVELKDNEGFIGDRVIKGAFRKMIDDIREAVRKGGDDPLGEEETYKLSKAELDSFFLEGDPEIAGIVQGAVEDFSQELTGVIIRYLRLIEWKDIERIVIGGGFRPSRIGELVAGYTMVLLKQHEIDIDLVPIHHHPDEAGLLGAIHLGPVWIFKAFDAVLGVDIGGTNIRADVVQLNLKKSKKLTKAKVWKYLLWRHADDAGVKRHEAAVELSSMLKELIVAATKKHLKIAPFIGIGCPGVIEEDGSIDRGAQNLPGNWESNQPTVCPIRNDSFDRRT